MKPRKLKITFGDIPDLPKEVKPSILCELKRCEKYIPHWCATVAIIFRTRGDDAANARIQTHPDYFSAHLSINPRWLDLDATARHHTFLHEIGHLHHAAAYQQACSMIMSIAEGDSRELLQTILDRAFEQSAEGFALMIESIEGI